MARYLDISVPTKEGMPVWPGSSGVAFDWVSRIEDGSVANGSTMQMDVHVGTHIDAPLHFVSGGASVGKISLDTLIGPALVLAVPDAEAITADVLDSLEVPERTERLLLKTRNSGLWRSSPRKFRKDYMALTECSARWVVGRGIRLIGIDYLSIQRFHDGPEVHQILLGAEVVIVEGLDLHDVEPGGYELTVLPIRLDGIEAAPARAVLRVLE
jgi:arylformamidase